MKRFALKKNQLIVLSFIIAFTLVGSALLLRSHAATGFVNAEPENGTFTTPAVFVADTTASNGKAIKFVAGTTPTPTPTPSPGTCSGAANTPGGADPWGGCFPGPKTTGVPAGVTLANYTGPTNITQAGTVVQNVKITACITIAKGADNVSFKNVLFQANGCYWEVLNNGGSKLSVTDSEFDGLNNTSGDAAIAGGDFTLTRVNIHGTVDGLKLGSNVTVQDSYIHDLIITADSHNDGMQSLGSDDVVIKHNSEIVKQGATSCIILSTGAADSIHRVAISNNLFAGGAYTVYAGYEKGVDNLSVVGSISLTNNRFSTVINANGGGYGPLASADPPAVTLSGNLWADGPKAGQVVQ